MLLVHQEYGRIVKSLKLMETRNPMYAKQYHRKVGPNGLLCVYVLH
jgi:hypothetical protein